MCFEDGFIVTLLSGTKGKKKKKKIIAQILG